MDELLRLYPGPSVEEPLKGTYLKEDVRKLGSEQNRPFVYANFIASLDGRIAVQRKGDSGLAVPGVTANERDWRLFQELATQADIIISSGRYLRDWAAGRAQEILRVDDERFADLRVWRSRRRLPAQPDIVVLSHQLDFEVPQVLQEGGRRAIVFADFDANPERIASIERQVSDLHISTPGGWSGRAFVDRLFELGYRTIYSAAGPKVLHMLLSGGALDRQYLTLAPRMLGGESFSTLLEGPLLEPPAGFRLKHILLDRKAFEGSGQLFLAYDSVLSSSKID